jgi:tetraacyldisaccharide 4'-kinase
MTLVAHAESLLARHWWRATPTALSTALRPLAAVYGWLARRQRARAIPQRAPVPVIVVGNYIVGGAGKTPTVIALVLALSRAGRKPGVLSRGYGRNSDEPTAVAGHESAAAVGDEPLLIRRRTGVPVWVGRDRLAAARALCRQHPEVDVLVCDDGLQHHALARVAELVVFDERGAGNGLLLPAGPLRQALPPTLPPRQRVLYTNGRPSTPLPGTLAARRVDAAWPLSAWRAGNATLAQPLHALQGRPLLAAAGVAAPEKFFAMLTAAGLTIERLALPDHYAFGDLPWPADTPEVLVTEKDAIKLDPARLGSTQVWVLPLDLQMPSALVDDLLSLLTPDATP